MKLYFCHLLMNKDNKTVIFVFLSFIDEKGQ